MPAQRWQELPEEVDAQQEDMDKLPEDELESDRSNSSGSGDKEYVIVKLSDIRKEVQCPICLGVIRKTRTVMECLHRFCRECIDKSMRLGNNECPACRTHCASRRSLRDDPNYDALIAALYPDIDKYEEEESALHEDEMSHNKQIQASIAQTFQRQTEALIKKRNAKSTAVAFEKRSPGNHQTSRLWRRRNSRNISEPQESNDNEDVDDNDGVKGSSSGDEQTETKTKRGKRGGETQFPQDSSIADADGAGEENDSDVNREIISSSTTLSWGKNGQRTRANGKNANGKKANGKNANGKNAENSRLSKLADLLHNSEVNDEELDIYLMLVSVDEQSIPSLQQPYLCCRPTLSVMKLCQYIALETAMQADEIEVCVVKEPQASILRAERPFDPHKDKLHSLGEQETLAELNTHDNISCGHLLMVYKRKLGNSVNDTVEMS